MWPTPASQCVAGIAARLAGRLTQQPGWLGAGPIASGAAGPAACTRLHSSATAAGAGAHAAHAAPQLHGTTVLCVRKDGDVVLLADGQLTLGDKVLKHSGRKIRRLALGALGGFAGSTADGLTLFERLEAKLEAHPGQLRRAAVELAKAWRQDRVLRYLQATMIVADASTCLEVSGSGEVLEPSDGVHAIGSGARFAIAAARALIDQPQLSALEVAQRAMRIAADKCIYTNDRFLWEGITADGGNISNSSSGGGGGGSSPLAQVEKLAGGASSAAAAQGSDSDSDSEPPQPQQ